MVPNGINPIINQNDTGKTQTKKNEWVGKSVETYYLCILHIRRMNYLNESNLSTKIDIHFDSLLKYTFNTHDYKEKKP